MNWAEIKKLDENISIWWWNIKWIDEYADKQIWAKWTISQNTLWKQYLTKDLYDPEVWDYKESDTKKKLIEYWIWRYVYAVYVKPTWDSWDKNKTGTYYNMAYTLQKEWSDTYITKIVGDYDAKSCFDNEKDCPKTLIWSWDNVLVDWQEQWKTANWTAITGNFGSAQENQWIPYAVTAFE
jgi:hypothetical protein